MKAIVYGLIACSLLVPTVARASCLNPVAIDSVLTESQATTQNDTNFGYYAWIESQQEWVLQGEAFFASAEQESMITGDEFFGQEVFSGGGGGSGGGPGRPTRPNAVCAPFTMPRVVATGTRPSGGMSFMGIYRPAAYRSGGISGGGSGGFGRKTKGGVKQADKNVRCTDDYEYRKSKALAALPALTFAPGAWMVMYGGGHFEMWLITSPLFSDKGLVSQGCKSG